ncbi:MAG: lycopene cyclase family protein [Bacteroidota bacterium]
MSRDYDVIIAGFGLSGMTIVYEMSKLKGFAEKSILVIDSDKKNKNDRTWSFWSNEKTEYEAMACKTWDKCFFYSENGDCLDLDLGDYRYYTIRGIDFYEFIFDKLQGFTNITFLTEQIEEVSDEGYVKTASGKYTADRVCRSYFDKNELESVFKSDFIWQHFKGWYIETKNDAFEENCFTVMDYRVSAAGKIDFFYVLPFTKNTALVEFTEFSREFYEQSEYDDKIKSYIKNTLKIDDYTVSEEEFNAIPMTSAKLKPVKNKLINVGTVAGYVKPSSGYAFTRIVKNSKTVAKSIMEGSKIQSRPKYAFFYRLMDSTLLEVFDRNPDTSKRFYYSLFKKLKAYEIFGFLDEKSSFPKISKVFLSAADYAFTFIVAMLTSFYKRLS